MTKVAFMFPGQGSLEEGMGREIVEAVPEARVVFREGTEAAGIDLEKLCFETPLETMVETENQQPALVATSLAIYEAIRARGIVPDFVVGHSVGEFAALAAARSLSPAEAIAPARVSSLAIARPIPREAPVTSAVFPSSDANSAKRFFELVETAKVAHGDDLHALVDPLQ